MKRLHSSYDVAIVGAGPAGAWCACRLAEAGAAVALIDASHPREKPCGGGVTARALALLGERIREDGVQINEATFAFGDRMAHVPLPTGDAGRLGVYSRRDFDRRILQRAARAGASLVAERVTGVERNGSGWRVLTRHDVLSARWLLGADGATSLVRKRVSQPFARGDLSIACGYFIRGFRAQRIEIVFEANPSGYLWSFPRPDHLAVGVCAQADEASVATLMPIVDRWCAVRLREAGLAESGPTNTQFERYSWPIPSLTAAALEREAPAGDGWMLLGDAAGLVDPITREGIYFALQSGELAAASIIGNRDPSAAYTTRLRDTIYDELIGAARLKARFYRPAFIALLISALRRSARIRTIMADLVAGEQPYRTLRRRLLKTLELRLMLELAVSERSSRPLHAR